MAKVRDRDVHTVAMPYFGGVAILAGVAAAFLVAINLPFLGKQAVLQNDSGAVLIGAAVICAVGVLDDLFELNALAKLAGQVLAAGLVVHFGVKMLYIPLQNRTISLDDTASIAITVFFIVLCSNSVNYVDGLDGLAAGVVCIGALAFFAYSYLLYVDQHLVRATTSSLITVAIAGGLPRLLAAQLLPGQDVHGRLRRPAARLPVGHLDDQPDRSDRLLTAGGHQRRPGAGLSAPGAAGGHAVPAVPGLHPGLLPSHLRGSVVVRRRQTAPPPHG